MRANLIDGLILGLGIGVVVLGARWMFPGALIVELSVVMVGGLLLALAQIGLSRYRARHAPSVASVARDPAPAPQLAPLHSPRLLWPDSSPAAEPPDAEPASVTAAGAELPAVEAPDAEAAPATASGVEPPG